MDLERAKQTFFEEARELLAEMEQGILNHEMLPPSQRQEAMNALFRAIHTIKGSAGLFGFEAIVGFTHRVESVLDRLRGGELAMDEKLVNLLLACRDFVEMQVEMLAQGEDVDPAEGQALVEQLAPYEHAAPAGQAPTPVHALETVEASGNGTWHLSLRFAKDILANGMDPASFLRYLGTLGRIVHVVTLLDPLPGLDEMDPEACYLGFEVALETQADKAAIEGVFEFVLAGSHIRILPPRSKVAEYIELIQSLPEDPLRLGDILVRCGALTQHELEEGLAIQQAAAEQAGPNRPAKRLGEVLVEERDVPAPVVQAALTKQKVSEEKRREARFIKVEAARLDHLIDLVGELVIAGASANLMARKSRSGELVEATQHISNLIEQIRGGALSMRMVQVGDVFARFPRVVRDLSQELDKDIDLHISGADTELDKSMVEKLTDPLTHLVRNAIDHGIERMEVRREKGKPERGNLWLNAYHESGSIVIEVSDDGAGLDKDRILSKALERGLVQPDQALSDQEIFRMIFEPGFSTVAQVTNLSGRGVGMDVVRRNIDALRGTIEIDSEAGQGATFRLRLPLTLAIIDGFLVESAGRVFVVPLDMILECVAQEAETGARRGGYVNLRGEVLPLVRLRDLFGFPGAPPARENVVVVSSGEQKAGLVVDVLHGEFQTVIKPLGQLFSGLKSVSGSTILGSGQVALILDVPSLIREACSHEHSAVGEAFPH